MVHSLTSSFTSHHAYLRGGFWKRRTITPYLGADSFSLTMFPMHSSICGGPPQYLHWLQHIEFQFWSCVSSSHSLKRAHPSVNSMMYTPIQYIFLCHTIHCNMKKCRKKRHLAMGSHHHFFARGTDHAH